MITSAKINEGYEEADLKATELEPGFELLSCSPEYMHEHFASGDNPKANPWGELPLDIQSQREKNPDAVAKLEKYDEWPFLERSPFFESMRNARRCDEVTESARALADTVQ